MEPSHDRHAASLGYWIAGRKPNPLARLRLFCLPYAGGSALIFRAWSNALPADIEVCPIQLPGRSTRSKEQPFTEISALIQVLAQALSSLLDRPFAIFGHSLGALIGFELARQLRRQYSLSPVRLFVSGGRAPQESRRDSRHLCVAGKGISSGGAPSQRHSEGGVGARRADGDHTSFVTG